MPIPNFYEDALHDTPDLRIRIADRIRVGRRQTGLSQRHFAEKCGIPLRTFKRVENGTCDSLDAFLRIIIAFERISALELLFPPRPAKVTPMISATIALERLRERIKK